MYLYVGMYHDFVMDGSSITFLRIHIMLGILERSCDHFVTMVFRVCGDRRKAHVLTCIAPYPPVICCCFAKQALT